MINDYKNNNILSDTETIILDNLAYWADSVNNKSVLCNVGCNVWGGLWGLGASAIAGPWAGLAVGIYAGTTRGAVCEYYENNY